MLSWLLLVASAVVTVWLAARVFRIGMLSYGQRLDWASIKAALRSGMRSYQHDAITYGSQARNQDNARQALVLGYDLCFSPDDHGTYAGAAVAGRRRD